MTLTEFRTLFTGPLMGNCGYERQTAETAIVTGSADLIAFGRPVISNPDLVARFRHDRPLAPESDPATWYSGAHAAEGYTDFPTDAVATDADPDYTRRPEPADTLAELRKIVSAS